MAKNVVQKITFKNTKPAALYELYMNAKKHSFIAGSPVKISSKAGSPFTAHMGYISGASIHNVKDKLIVQSWRSAKWAPADPDSTFTIVLEPKGRDTVLHAIHTNVPDADAEGVTKGWFDHYWNPWKQHLAGKKITRPSM